MRCRARNEMESVAPPHPPATIIGVIDVPLSRGYSAFSCPGAIELGLLRVLLNLRGGLVFGGKKKMLVSSAICR